MAEYLIHKAVEFDKMTKAAKVAAGISTLADLNTRYMAQRKYDGCNAVAVVTPNGEDDRVMSRTGEIVKSCNHILRAVRSACGQMFARGQAVAVLGEVWTPGREFAEISGAFRRHNAEPALEFKAFDIVRNLNGDDTQFHERSATVHRLFRGGVGAVSVCETYNPGTYGDAQDFANHLVQQGGYDGLILRDPLAGWYPSSGTDGAIIKVKNVQSYDLLVIGREEGKGKYKGTLGALVCRGPKGEVRVSGMTDEQRDEWWRESAEADNSGVLGAIIQVDCLGFTNTGSFREPRFKGIRYDKEHADF